MTYPYKPVRQNVLHKTTHKLHRTQRHLLCLAAIFIILVTEYYLLIIYGFDAMIAYCHLMRIATQIFDDLHRPTKGTLGIHHPFCSKSAVQQGWVGNTFAAQDLYKFCPEYLGQRLYRI